MLVKTHAFVCAGVEQVGCVPESVRQVGSDQQAWSKWARAHALECICVRMELEGGRGGHDGVRKELWGSGASFASAYVCVRAYVRVCAGHFDAMGMLPRSSTCAPCCAARRARARLCGSTYAPTVWERPQARQAVPHTRAACCTHMQVFKARAVAAPSSTSESRGAAAAAAPAALSRVVLQCTSVDRLPLCAPAAVPCAGGSTVLAAAHPQVRMLGGGER